MNQKYARVCLVFKVYVEHSIVHVQIKHVTQKHIITSSVFKCAVSSLDLTLGWLQNKEVSFVNL